MTDQDGNLKHHMESTSQLRLPRTATPVRTAGEFKLSAQTTGQLVYHTPQESSSSPCGPEQHRPPSILPFFGNTLDSQTTVTCYSIMLTSLLNTTVTSASVSATTSWRQSTAMNTDILDFTMVSDAKTSHQDLSQNNRYLHVVLTTQVTMWLCQWT